MYPGLEAFREGETERAPVERVKPGLEPKGPLRHSRPLCCAACGRPLTDVAHRLAVHGSHEHRFMNPDGFVFDLGSFAEAPGCRVRGLPSDEFTWFPGYRWRYAHCGGCETHVGWVFERGGWSGFFGLVLNRLVEGGEEGPARD